MMDVSAVIPRDSGDAMAIVVHLAKAVAYRPDWRPKLSLQIAAFYRYLGGTFEMSRADEQAAEYYEKAAEWTSVRVTGEQVMDEVQAIEERHKQADSDRRKARQLRQRAIRGSNVSYEAAR